MISQHNRQIELQTLRFMIWYYYWRYSLNTHFILICTHFTSTSSTTFRTSNTSHYFRYLRWFLFGHGSGCGSNRSNTSWSTIRNVWVDFSNSTNGFSPSLSEHHPWICVNILRVLDEMKKTGGLVSSSEMFFIHTNNGSCLTSTTTMN